MTAADILRERARQTENVSSAAFAPTSPDLLRAVADLMDARRSHVDGRDLLAELLPMHWHYCNIRVRINGEWRDYEGDWLKRLHVALAALERLIEGERDADR